MRRKPAIVLRGATTGLLVWPSLRRMIRAAGYRIVAPLPFTKASGVAVWGRLPQARKAITNLGGREPVITFEDAFLRSVLPGTGTPPVGMTIDDLGVHFDGHSPSRLETILQNDPLDSPDLMRRARDGMDFMRHYGLSKYNAVRRGFSTMPATDYVVVIDQVANDASIAGSGADAGVFDRMLATAIAENPGRDILVRTHPAGGPSRGHFGPGVEGGNVRLLSGAHNPVDILEGAARVYCVSSQMGFEAILLGHRPVVFGTPFYAGWGLSDDRALLPAAAQRRTRRLGREQLFSGAMLVFPFWFNRASGSACTFEEAAAQLLAESRRYRDGLRPSVAAGMRLWKRTTVSRFLDGAGSAPEFRNPSRAVGRAKRGGRQVVVWAGAGNTDLVRRCKQNTVPLIRMEDGFLRSCGLGANLVPAVSLVLDDLGIYYDAQNPSRLERLIAASGSLPPFAIRRAENLRRDILAAGVTKYNLGATGPLPDLPQGRPVVLVPGQVEDDASIRTGAGRVNTNLALLAASRADNPDAFLIYKPHPDVLAGLRAGHIPPATALEYCDFIATGQDVAALIDVCDSLSTMTSLTGFEALLRGKPVTCYGMPFYAGWGLTTDCGATCARRRTGITLAGLVHATLIDYPRYIDPVSKLACSPELVVARLDQGNIPRPRSGRILAGLQGIFASYAFIWRKGSRRS